MPESYEAIIEEIKKCHILDYAARYGINTAGTSLNDDYRNCIKHIAARVREAVGGDPTEWWVEDADGNRVHIGDEVRKGDEPPDKVMGLGVYGEAPVVFVSFSAWNYADRVHKIVPDTREKIINDTIVKWKRIPLDWRDHEAERVAIINDAIDRAMKLAEVDA